MTSSLLKRARLRNSAAQYQNTGDRLHDGGGNTFMGPIVAIHKAAAYILLKGTRQQCRLIKLTIGLHQSRLGRQQAFRRRRRSRLVCRLRLLFHRLFTMNLPTASATPPNRRRIKPTWITFLKYVQVLEWGAEQATTAAQICCKLKHVGQPIEGPYRSPPLLPTPYRSMQSSLLTTSVNSAESKASAWRIGRRHRQIRMRQPPENVIRRRAEAIRRAVVCYGCRTKIATYLRRRHTPSAVGCCNVKRTTSYRYFPYDCRL